MNTEILAALDWRYATKKFDPTKKISARDWETLKQSLLKAPSSYGLQPWKFLHIDNQAIREQLKPVSWNQTQVTESSHYVVFLSRDKVTTADIDHYMSRTAEVRGVSTQSLNGFKDMLISNIVEGKKDSTLEWTRRQAYIAMGFLLQTAALLKIDATPMEGFDPTAYDKILGLEGSGWKSVASVALGYRHPDDAYQKLKKVRFEESEVIQKI